MNGRTFSFDFTERSKLALQDELERIDEVDRAHAALEIAVHLVELAAYAVARRGDGEQTRSLFYHATELSKHSHLVATERDAHKDGASGAVVSLFR